VHTHPIERAFSSAGIFPLKALMCALSKMFYEFCGDDRGREDGQRQEGQKHEPQSAIPAGLHATPVIRHHNDPHDQREKPTASQLTALAPSKAISWRGLREAGRRERRARGLRY
jgi:hypothetical protein